MKYPLVTLFIFSYNQEEFIADAIEGALSQDYSNLEIVISDDCSIDKTWEVIQSVLAENHGPHKITLNRNEKNLGIANHINTILNELCKGEIIFVAAGDDISMPNRVSETVDLLNKDKSIMAVTGQLVRIDKNGKEMDIQPTTFEADLNELNDDYIKTTSFMCGGAGLAIRREVWNVFGSLLSECPTEDSTLRFRSLLLGKLAVSPNTFIKYRIHDTNISRPSNIYNLKTQGIVAQLRHDLKLAEDKKLISQELAGRLEKKIKLYERSREIAAAKMKKPLFIRAYYKVLQRFVAKQVRNI